MRAIWSGSLSFGLINLPVRLYNASDDQPLTFNLLHKKDLSPIHYVRICQADGREVPYKDIVKGYKYETGHYVVLVDEDFKKANIRKTKSIDILDFTNADEIDSVYFEKPYFLEPDKGSDKAYVLLREALKKSKKVGIARFVLRNREHIGVIKPYGKLLILDQLRFASEIRKPVGLHIPTEESHSKREVEMALKLIESLSTPFHPEKYHDTYTKELKKVIKQKAQGKTPVPKGQEPKITRTDDLMKILKESLEQHQRKTA